MVSIWVGLRTPTLISQETSILLGLSPAVGTRSQTFCPTPRHRCFFFCHSSQAMPNTFPSWCLLIPVLSPVGVEEWSHPWTRASEQRCWPTSFITGFTKQILVLGQLENRDQHFGHCKAFADFREILEIFMSHSHQRSCITPASTSSLHWTSKAWVMSAGSSCSRNSTENKDIREWPADSRTFILPPGILAIKWPYR